MFNDAAEASKHEALSSINRPASLLTLVRVQIHLVSVGGPSSTDRITRAWILLRHSRLGCCGLNDKADRRIVTLVNSGATGSQGRQHHVSERLGSHRQQSQGM